MDPIRIPVYVSPAAAVRAGKLQSGEGHYTPTEAELSELSEAERTELALALVLTSGCGRLGRVAGDPDMVEPSWSEVRRVISARCVHRAEEAEKHAAAAARREEEARCAEEARREFANHVATLPDDDLLVEEDGRWSVRWQLGAHYINAVVPGPRRLALEHEAERRNDERAAEAARRREDLDRAYRAAVNDLGDDSQRRRLAAGVLPEDEGWALIRNHVFGGIEGVTWRSDEYSGRIQRYSKLTATYCPGGDPCRGEHGFSLSPVAELTAAQFEAVEAVRKAAPEGATIAVSRHKMTCSDGPDQIAHSVKVTLNWHGRELSRRYAIPSASLPPEELTSGRR